MADIEWRSIPPWRQDHVLHGARISSVTCTGQPEGQWGDVPPVIEIGSRQGTLLNPHQIKAANYGVPGYQELPGGFVGPYTYPDVGHTSGVSELLPVPFPENQGNEFPRNASQGAVPNTPQAALPDPSAQRAPAPGQPATENLRQLASRYLNHPDSNVDMVRMEPGPAGRYKVVIVLGMADLV